MTCACSDCFVWSSTGEASGGISTGAAAPVSRRLDAAEELLEPSRRPSPIRPPMPTTIRSGRYHVSR